MAGLVADHPPGGLGLFEIPLQGEGSVVDGFGAFFKESERFGGRQLDEVRHAAVSLGRRRPDTRSHEGVEGDSAHSRHPKGPEGHILGRRAFPERRVLDVGRKEALLEKERIGAIWTGHTQPSLDPGFTQRDVFAVAVWRDEFGVVIGVETAC